MNIEKLQQNGQIKTIEKGSVIVKEGEPGETAFLILLGRAEVYLGSFTDSSKKICDLKQGTIFGEMSLLENKPRNATVLAGSDMTVLEITKEGFLDFLKTEPEGCYNMFASLRTRLDNTMASTGNSMISYVSEIKRDPKYVSLSKLDLIQFVTLVAEKPEYAMTLLKFMSYKLNQVNEKIIGK